MKATTKPGGKTVFMSRPCKDAPLHEVWAVEIFDDESPLCHFIGKATTDLAADYIERCNAGLSLTVPEKIAARVSLRECEWQED